MGEAIPEIRCRLRSAGRQTVDVTFEDHLTAEDRAEAATAEITSTWGRSDIPQDASHKSTATGEANGKENRRYSITGGGGARQATGGAVRRVHQQVD
ncbi:hypothetical protein L249_0198 [Ophiocordyceps polyrhachis-furcata BCC 54312]|uniref:Uncharacterized protein n=1 Tax=Ophiocordyceps polyrhachis-furcata BCC 54312 TaxID=1330021 RepID=A0A367LF87_9HYPO|nr:hypothetical protein L249_0198 [Ophiocordyceps polyrhachis-furcata BCC 54312]